MKKRSPFVPRKTETAFVTEAEWEKMMKPISKKRLAELKKELEEVKKLFKRITPEEACAILEKEVIKIKVPRHKPRSGVKPSKVHKDKTKYDRKAAKKERGR